MSIATNPELQPAIIAAATAAAAAAGNAEPQRRARDDGGYENGAAKRTKVSNDTSQLGLGEPDRFGNHPDGRQARNDLHPRAR